jgi:SAM-dependent methyltransferase
MTKIFKKDFVSKENLIQLDIKDKVVKEVINFYKEAPFPNYEDEDDKSTINFKGDQNILAKRFKDFIGFNKDVLEVGCGTGQMSLYFSIGTNNRVFALDPTIASINLGKTFANQNKIKNIKFVNADIFDDVFENEVFDFIWSNGVLHHTKDPSKGFDVVSKYLKKNGYILVGLYNKFGRLRTIFRRLLYKIFGKSVILLLDPIVRNLKKNSNLQINSWIRDQYEHPVESLHTLDEVLVWFERNNIEFINSIPSCDLNSDDGLNLFKKHSKGTFLSRFFSQVSMLFNNLGADGGLFIVIGKKNEK